MKSRKQKTDQLTVRRQWLIVSALVVVLFGFATAIYVLERDDSLRTARDMSQSN